MGMALRPDGGLVTYRHVSSVVLAENPWLPFVIRNQLPWAVSRGNVVWSARVISSVVLASAASVSTRQSRCARDPP